MTDQSSAPGGSPRPISASPQIQVEEILRYLDQHRGLYTEDALVAAVRGQGYPETAITEAVERARALEGVGPGRARTRSAVLGAYLVTYLLLSLGMLANGNGGGIIILSGSLGIAAVFAVILLNGRQRTDPKSQGMLAALVLIPVLMLAGVAGLCLSTGMPLGPYSIF